MAGLPRSYARGRDVPPVAIDAEAKPLHHLWPGLCCELIFSVGCHQHAAVVAGAHGPIGDHGDQRSLANAVT